MKRSQSSSAVPNGRTPIVLGGTALLIAVAVLGAAWWLGRGPVSERIPAPIVLISIDTLRADHLPVYGYQAVHTPAIDALAADGVVFENAYTQAPQTLPAHVSILSGRLPFEHGVRDNVGFTVKPGEKLLPSILHDAGYTTGGFVSAYVLRRDTGIAAGFDHFDDRLPPASPEIAIGDLQRDGTATEAAAEAWLDTLSSPRFFLFLHLYEPHSPYDPPARFRQYAPYDGEIAYADEIVGKLVASLERRGLYDNALIVLLSDHGEGLGDHGEQEHGLFLYRETIHVPLIVKLPGREDAGRRVAAPVQHIDLVPTLLDSLHLPARPDLRGRSLRPLFAGGTIPEQGLYAEALYSRYHFGWSELYALTDSRYSYIRAPHEELYDLQYDPGERRNLAPERESTSTAMRGALDALTRGAPLDAPAEVSADARERLRALGYVGVAPTAGAAPKTDLPDPKDKVEVLERYRAAIAQVHDGRYDEALSNFQAIVRDNPAMADVWSEIGGLDVRLGRRDAALAAYKRLVEVAPNDPAALISVAETLLALGRVDEARAQAALAARTGHDAHWQAHAHQTLAMIALARQDVPEARREARQANAIDPGLPLPDYIEGLIRYHAGQFEAAVPFLQRALQQSAGGVQLPQLRYYLGDSLARLERYGQAEPILSEEARLFPSELQAHAALAMLYRATGRNERADEQIAAIDRSPLKEARDLSAKLRQMFGAQ